jgi:hypothetical protein
MKEIELFNGDVLEFPDDTPDEVLDRVARQETSQIQMAATQGRGTRDQREAIDPAQQAQAEFEAMPWYGKAGQAAQDIARIGVDGLTYGYGDKLGAKMGELAGAGSYDDNIAKLRAETEAARARSGMAGTVADIGGQILGPSKLLGAAKMLPGAGAVGSALSKVPGAKTLSAVGGGAGLGALNAAGHDQDITGGAVIGGAAGLAGRALAPVVSKAAGAVGRAVGINKAPSIMTREELQAAKDAAYKASEDAGVIIKTPALRGFVHEVKQDLAGFGFRPTAQPHVASILKELEDVAAPPLKAVGSEAPVVGASLKHLDEIRKSLGLLQKGVPTAEGEAARQLSKKIDKFLENVNPNDVIVSKGTKTEALKALLDGRKYHRALRTSQMIEEAMQKAARTASVGGHPETAIKSQFRTILNSRTRSRFLSKDEKAAMDAVVNGTTARNLARLIGRLSPQHPLGLLFHGGSAFATGGVSAMSAIGGAAGIVGRAVGERGTKSAVQYLDKIARAGGDASAIRAAPNAAQRLTQAKGPALIRALGISGLRPEDPPPY